MVGLGKKVVGRKRSTILIPGLSRTVCPFIHRFDPKVIETVLEGTDGGRVDVWVSIRSQSRSPQGRPDLTSLYPAPDEFEYRGPPAPVRRSGLSQGRV